MEDLSGEESTGTGESVRKKESPRDVVEGLGRKTEVRDGDGQYRTGGVSRRFRRRPNLGRSSRTTYFRFEG